MFIAQTMLSGYKLAARTKNPRAHNILPKRRCSMGPTMRAEALQQYSTLTQPSYDLSLSDSFKSNLLHLAAMRICDSGTTCGPSSMPACLSSKFILSLLLNSLCSVCKISVHDLPQDPIWNEVLVFHELICHWGRAALLQPFSDVLPLIGVPISSNHWIMQQFLQRHVKVCQVILAECALCNHQQPTMSANKQHCTDYQT